MAHEPRPMTRAQVSGLFSISDSLVSRNAKSKWSEAVLPDGRLDIAHPVIVDYARRSGKKIPPRSMDKRTYTPRGPDEGTWPPPDGPGSNDDLREISDAFQPLLERFGTSDEMEAWIKPLKEVEETIAKRLKNARDRGDLIERDKVRGHVFGALDRLHRNLLRDAAATIVARLYSMARAGESVEEAQKVVRSIISSHLRPAQSTASRVIDA